MDIPGGLAFWHPPCSLYGHDCHAEEPPMKITGKRGQVGGSAHCWLQTAVGTRGIYSLVVLALALGCQDPGAVPETAVREARVRGNEQAPAGPTRIVIGARADLGLSHARVVVHGTWGTADGQFGRDEAGARPGPLSLAVDRNGDILVLDQENARVQRFTAEGARQPPLTGVSGTTMDLAVTGGAVWTLAYLPESGPGHAVHRLGPGGPELTVPLDRGLELLTGLFATGPDSAPDLWVEQNQDTQVRVVREGRAVAPAEQGQGALGRPVPGNLVQRVTARKAGEHRALVMTVDPERGVEPVLEITTVVPLVAIQELYADATGAIYIGLFMAAEGPAPDFAWQQIRKVVVAWRPDTGHAAKVVEMAALMDTMVTRPVTVGPDGALYQLHTTEQEVVVRRWDPLFEEVRP